MAYHKQGVNGMLLLTFHAVLLLISNQYSYIANHLHVGFCLIRPTMSKYIKGLINTVKCQDVNFGRKLFS